MESPLRPIASSDWNARRAQHLLNRAGFGIPRSLVDRLAALTPEGAVDYLIEYDRAGETVQPPDFLIPPKDPKVIREELAGLSEEERRKRAQEMRREEREAVERLQAWWIERMYTTRCPLREKLTLFWHGHFAASAQKVRSSAANYQLNDVFRRHAAGNFKALTVAVGQSPAMLRYLDNLQSTREHPNENWARELMELFTLGQGHYTERDIKESARAFTGWSAGVEGFRIREEVQDFGMKEFMGRRGNFDGWDVIDIIFEQPAAAEFIAGKLWAYFAFEEPSRSIIEELAKTVRASDYEMKPLLRQMLLSQAFYSDAAMGTQIKSPAQYALQLADDLGIQSPPYNQMAKGLAQLGQNLFYPPNVKGWEGNRAWINANSLLLRYNMPGQLVAAKRQRDRRPMTEAERLDAPMQAQGMSVEMQAQGDSPKEAAWQPRQAVAGLRFTTAGELIGALERRFLHVSLGAEQREALIEALGVAGGPAAPLHLTDLPKTNIQAVLHLLMSTAEYQLC